MPAISTPKSTKPLPQCFYSGRVHYLYVRGHVRGAAGHMHSFFLSRVTQTETSAYYADRFISFYEGFTEHARLAAFLTLHTLPCQSKGLKYFRSNMPISPGDPKKPQLAFLGPLGTYSHQAAFGFFGDSVDYLPRATIADVQQTLSAVVPFGIIPQENSTNGSVVETYDILRIPAVGQETYVRGITVLKVKHSLVVRRGVKLEGIEKVLSHEQALGQCRKWLAEHLPRASLVSTDSTAKAAQKLLSPEDGLDPMSCAAICSSVVVTMYEGLEVLEDGIQDGTENVTRFYILSHGTDVVLPDNCPLATQSMALLRFQSDPSKQPPNLSGVISTLNLTISRIDRRPSLHPMPFDDVYFLEVGAIPGSPKRSWTELLQQAAERMRGMSVEVSILGSW